MKRLMQQASGMSSFASYKRNCLLPQPKVLASSKDGFWGGAEFFEIEVPCKGSFQTCDDKILIYYVLDRIKSRIHGSSRIVEHGPFEAQISLPYRAVEGTWDGAGRGYHLFIDPDTIETYTHIPYNGRQFSNLDCMKSTAGHLLGALSADVNTGHKNGPSFGESVVHSVLESILDGACVSGGRAGKEFLPEARISRAIEYIHANLSNPIFLEQLAKLMNCSLRQLSRTFRQVTGYTPHRFIMIQRVNRAKELISNRRLALHDVATLSGFAHQAHMADTFRKVLGISPSKIRSELS